MLADPLVYTFIMACEYYIVWKLKADPDAFSSVLLSQYAMRIWLDPDRLTDYQLTVEEVIGALKTYNVEVSASSAGLRR